MILDVEYTIKVKTQVEVQWDEVERLSLLPMVRKGQLKRWLEDIGDDLAEGVRSVALVKERDNELVEYSTSVSFPAIYTAEVAKQHP